jgi:hypothetical protein
MWDELITYGINLNTTAASENVPDVERQIRVLKERARALRSTLPFKIIPGRMIIEMLANVVLWINVFPPSSGVSKTFSPRTIMTGTALNFNKHCQIPFEAYAEVHEDNNITNTMTERTQPAICLGPTANFQGSYKFLLLKTGKWITRKQFKELPMADSVILKIEAMANREKQDKVITFSNRSGDLISDSISALYDSPDTTDVNAAAGVYNDENDDENDNYTNGDNESPGITLEDQTPEYGENPKCYLPRSQECPPTPLLPLRAQECHQMEWAQEYRPLNKAQECSQKVAQECTSKSPKRTQTQTTVMGITTIHHHC